MKKVYYFPFLLIFLFFYCPFGPDGEYITLQVDIQNNRCKNLILTTRLFYWGKETYHRIPKGLNRAFIYTSSFAVDGKKEASMHIEYMVIWDSGVIIKELFGTDLDKNLQTVKLQEESVHYRLTIENTNTLPCTP